MIKIKKNVDQASTDEPSDAQKSSRKSIGRGNQLKKQILSSLNKSATKSISKIESNSNSTILKNEIKLLTSSQPLMETTIISTDQLLGKRSAPALASENKPESAKVST
jgi:hypothetical protein